MPTSFHPSGHKRLQQSIEEPRTLYLLDSGKPSPTINRFALVGYGDINRPHHSFERITPGGVDFRRLHEHFRLNTEIRLPNSPFLSIRYTFWFGTLFPFTRIQPRHPHGVVLYVANEPVDVVNRSVEIKIVFATGESTSRLAPGRTNTTATYHVT